MDLTDILEAIFREKLDEYLDVVLHILVGELRVPEALLEKPIELTMAVNRQPRWLASAQDGEYRFVNMINEDAPLPPPPTAACYAPMRWPDMPYDCLWFDGNEFARDASRIGIKNEELARILLAHELVHVTMISRFVGGRRSDDADRWVFDKSLLYIHEGMALKVSAMLPQAIASEQAKSAYLKYVRDLARQIPEEQDKYGTYFDLSSRNVPLQDYWRTLIQTRESADTNLVTRLVNAARAE